MFATTQLASAEFQKLNLDDCIDLALKNNRTIEQSVELRENAKWILKRQRRATGSSLSWSGAVNKIGGMLLAALLPIQITSTLSIIPYVFLIRSILAAEMKTISPPLN